MYSVPDESSDLQTFEDVVQTYGDQVFNVCLGFMKDVEDAQDLAQEVFISAFQGYHTFKREAQISTWLYRIAVNKCLESIRKQQRQKRFAKRLSLQEMKEPAATSFYHPGVTLENRERSVILFAAMDALPEKQKAAFVLKQIEGLSQQEIAKVMKKSESSIESLLVRAKSNLRKTLRKYYEAHG